MRFCYINAFDDESYELTANSEDPSYPIENVKDYQLTKKYWTTGCSDEWVKIDGGASEAITGTFAFIAGHNLTVGATIKIQGNDTDVWTSPTVDETLTWASGIIWKAFAEDDLEFWRFTFADAANLDGVIKIGRLWLGTSYFDLTAWSDPAFDRQTVDTSVITRSVTGQVYGDERITYKEYTFQFPDLSDTDRVNLETMYETVKKTKPILLVPNPSDTTLLPIYGIITDWKLSHNIAWRWRASMTISEAL
jgi:hypothetical protein